VKSIVLLSGGLDSTVCLKKTVDEGNALLALTFDYGQKAAKKELAAARSICRKLKVKHQSVNLRWLGKLGNSALLANNPKVPQLDEGADKKDLQKAARDVWVANRNGVFINIGAAFAEGMGCESVVAGFNRDEAELFPDNSVQYLAAANTALRFSTLSGVSVASYTAYLSKNEILKLGMDIKAPLDLIWYCYLGGQSPCGRCQSCINFKKAKESL